MAFLLFSFSLGLEFIFFNQHTKRKPQTNSQTSSFAKGSHFLHSPLCEDLLGFLFLHETTSYFQTLSLSPAKYKETSFISLPPPPPSGDGVGCACKATSRGGHRQKDPNCECDPGAHRCCLHEQLCDLLEAPLPLPYVL